MPSDNVVHLPVPAKTADHVAVPASRRPAAPVVNLALLLRGAPPELQPASVAADMLATRSNALAAPIWRARRWAWLNLVIERKVRGRMVDRLCDEWRAAVRDAGISEKARRRKAEARVAAWIAAGGLHDVDAG